MAVISTALVVGAVGLAAVGTGVSMYGAHQQSKAAKQQAAAQQAQIEQERRAEAARMKAMELDARRRQLEMIRQQQRARSMALATTTAQGAAGGSGLMGAYGSFSGQTGVNQLGTLQNLYTGREMFDINGRISDARIAYAQAGSNMATAGGISAFGSGIASLGGSLMTATPYIGALTGGGMSSVAGGYYPGYNAAGMATLRPMYGNYR